MKTRTNAAAATDSFDLTWDDDIRVRDIFPIRDTKGTENIWMTDQVPPEELSKAVVSFLQCGQYDRPQVLAELIDLSRRGTQPLGGIKSSLDMILQSGVHGRKSAAIQFLSQLGSSSVKQLAASEPITGALGYTLVRALGALGERDCVIRFVGLADDSVREAAAEALDDIGGPKCIHVLEEMHEHDRSPFIRRLTGELLRDHQ
jgi:hypothetical protein